MKYSGIIAMKNALKDLSEVQVQFICKECDIDMCALSYMNERQVYDIVYETMCNIEIEEVCANIEKPDSERYAIASDIVTILGNAMAEAEGYQEDKGKMNSDVGLQKSI